MQKQFVTAILILLIAVAVVLVGFGRSCPSQFKLRPKDTSTPTPSLPGEVSVDTVGLDEARVKGYPTSPGAYLGYDTEDGDMVVDWDHPLQSMNLQGETGLEVWMKNPDQVVRPKEATFYFLIFPASRCSALMGDRLLEAMNWNPESMAQPRVDYMYDLKTKKGPAACFMVLVNDGQQYVFTDEDTSGFDKYYGWLIEYDDVH